MPEDKVGHPAHTLPGEYKIGDIYMGAMSPRRTLELVEEGKGPDYDVMVATYPRSGTARLVEVAWLLMNNIDVAKAKELSQTSRHLCLDMCDPTFETCFGGTIKVDEKNMPLVKTHLPYHMLEKHTQRDSKVIVGLRNPKDTLISFYHFYRSGTMLGKFKGSFSDFFSLIEDKHLIYGDIFDFSVGWWNARNQKNIMYVFYEDLTEDPVKEVKRMAEFLGKKYSDEDILKVVEWTSFGNMSAEKSTNQESLTHLLDFKISPYMRKGAIGDWKTTMTKEQSDYVDEQYKKTCAPVGLKFRFE